jgi:hypothetical protein
VTEGSDEPLSSYAVELKALDREAARVRRAEQALKDLRSIAGTQAIRAMKAGIAEGVLGVRSEVATHAPFSAPTVRALADENGIPPDQRYVRSAKPGQAEPAPAVKRKPRD